jgi:hypothetical protein
MKPKLAAFPKCYVDELCVHRTMTLSDWIEMGATLGVQESFAVCREAWGGSVDGEPFGEPLQG